MLRSGVKVMTGLFFFWSLNAQSATILYEETFDAVSSPTYSVVFGTPTVVGPIGPIATNSLEFNSTGNSPAFYYDQIRFPFESSGSPYQGAGFDSFSVSFDIYTEDLLGSPNDFTILFDTPTVRNLIFRGSGDIEVRNIGSGDSGVIGSYSDRQLLSIDMLFDIGADQWDILVDNAPLYSDSMDASFLRSIRFSHGAQTSGLIDFTATTYVDNILITTPSSIPEPTSIGLLAFGVLLCLGARRRRRVWAPVLALGR